MNTTKVISFRVSIDDYADFIERAKKMGVPLSDWVLITLNQATKDKRPSAPLKIAQNTKSKPKPKPKPKPKAIKPKKMKKIGRFPSYCQAIEATGKSFRKSRIGVGEETLSADLGAKVRRQAKSGYYAYVSN